MNAEIHQRLVAEAQELNAGKTADAKAAVHAGTVHFRRRILWSYAAAVVAVALVVGGAGWVQSALAERSPELMVLSVDQPPPLTVGQSKQTTATGTFSDGTRRDMTSTVTWSSGDDSVVTVGPKGLIRAIARGSTTVTAASGGVADSAQIIVTGVDTTVTLTSVTINPDPVNLKQGDELEIGATGTRSDGTTVGMTSSVTWSSGNSKVASVSPKGLIRAIAPGTTKVTATRDGITDTADVIVIASSTPTTTHTGSTASTSPVTLTSVEINPDPMNLKQGTELQASATGTLSDGGTVDLTGTAMWSSGNVKIAAISGQGLIHAVAPGNTTVTVDHDGRTGQAKVTVTGTGPVTLTSLSISPDSINLRQGDNLQLGAAGTYSDGSTRDLTRTVSWSSGNLKVATIDEQGTIRAVAPGATTVNAILEGKTGTASLAVLGLPDLVVVISSQPLGPCPYQAKSCDFTFNVRNAGRGPSPATQGEVTSFGADRPGRVVVQSLVPGQNVALKAKIPYPCGAGGCSATVSVDPDHQVAESHETNNTRRWSTVG